MADLGQHLVVLLATLDGASHLDRQLKSVADQDWSCIDIVASDDGSTDDTVAILQSWRDKWRKGRFEILEGPRKGPAENFRSLILRTPVDADFFAFCDQDDIWMPNKTRAAADALAADPGRPGLYCARTVLTNADGVPYGSSPHFRKQPDFRNALVQNIGGGNTMMINRVGFMLLRVASEVHFVAHDWFAYMLISGAGGHVTYSAEPHVLYCQHGSNAVGANIGIAARCRRMRLVLLGRFRGWNEINVLALLANEALLEPPARSVLHHFKRARESRGLRALIWLFRSGVYRQTAGGQASLFVACLLGKI